MRASPCSTSCANTLTCAAPRRAATRAPAAPGSIANENSAFDERTGRIGNPSLSGYHVPAHLDVPRIDVICTGIPDPHAPAGARGVGEIGITGTAAAVANAIFNASGRRVRDLPITLDKLL